MECGGVVKDIHLEGKKLASVVVQIQLKDQHARLVLVDFVDECGEELGFLSLPRVMSNRRIELLTSGTLYDHNEHG